jgi:hypothetical protein
MSPNGRSCLHYDNRGAPALEIGKRIEDPRSLTRLEASKRTCSRADVGQIARITIVQRASNQRFAHHRSPVPR